MKRLGMIVAGTALALALPVALPMLARSASLGPHKVSAHIHVAGSGAASGPCSAAKYGTYAAKCPSGNCSSVIYTGGVVTGTLTGARGTAALCVTLDNGDATNGCTPAYLGGMLNGKTDSQTINGFGAVCNVNGDTSILGGYSNTSLQGESGDGTLSGKISNNQTIDADLKGFEQAGA